MNFKRRRARDDDAMAPKKKPTTTGARSTSAHAGATAASFTGLRVGVTVVIDAGGGTLKVGIAEDGVGSVRVLANAGAKTKGGGGHGTAAKTLFGAEIDEARDVNGMTMRRPVDRGYVVNWELEREVLAHAFRHALGVDPTGCDLVITEPPFALPSVMQKLDETVFEYFKFRRACVATPAALVKRYADFVDEKSRGAKDLSVLSRSGVVVDCGFSFTHATTILDGKQVAKGIRRLNLGGKTLTNYLKELVSFRKWNMMDESVVIEDVKEKACYVADDALAELEKCKERRGGAVRREYVLPDGIHVLRGFVREEEAEQKENEESDDDDDDEDDEDFGARGPKKRKKKVPVPKKPKVVKADEPDHQVLTLVNERFMVPETLFNPSDIGAQQCGVCELVAQAIDNEDMEEAHQALCLLDVIVTGGCTQFANFMERFERDLRPLLSGTFGLRVRRASDPIKAALLGGMHLANDREFFESNAITREEYAAKKADIREAYQNFEYQSTITGRLTEYAAEPQTVDDKAMEKQCAALTPTLERLVIPAAQ